MDFGGRPGAIESYPRLTTDRSRAVAASIYPRRPVDSGRVGGLKLFTVLEKHARDAHPQVWDAYSHGDLRLAELYTWTDVNWMSGCFLFNLTISTYVL